MPESHDRHKAEKMDLGCRQESTSENYVLPHFSSDTLCVSAGESPIRAVSSIDENNLQHELNRKESGNDGRDLSIENNDIIVHITREELDREEEIVNSMRGAASIGKELSVLSITKSFTEQDDCSETPQEDCSLKESRLNILNVDQEAADIVYDTLRLMSEVLQLETEEMKREGSTLESEIYEPQHTDPETTSIEQDLVQDKDFAKDSLLVMQEGSNIKGQQQNTDEISFLLHDAPLIYPETSDIALAISRTSASAAKRKTSRTPRNTPHLSDVETGITCDITQSDMIDSCSGNPSDSSLADANTRQFHIMVRTHPDGGWGWVVCLGAFLVQFIALGMVNTAGIVYTELVKELKSQRGATGWYFFHVQSLF